MDTSTSLLFPMYHPTATCDSESQPSDTTAPTGLAGVITGILMHNAILQAFLLPCLMGSAVYAIRCVWQFFVDHCVQPYLYSCVSVPSSEAHCFDAVLQALALFQKCEASHLVVSARKRPMASLSFSSRHIPQRAEFDYRPATNGSSALLKFGGRTIYASRTGGENITVGLDRNVLKLETLHLRVLGPYSKVLRDFVDEAMRKYNRADHVRVFTGCPSDCSWDIISSSPPRPMDTIIVEGEAATLLEDARAFMAGGEWYTKMAIPFRRGYLLHGPPGTGKTSLCVGLAGALGVDLCHLTLSSSRLYDDVLCKLMRNVPPRAVVLLEDVDVIVPAAGKKQNITLSGMLNVLDGVNAPMGHILVMTSNHPELLPPSVLRPGRVDVKIHVGNASRSQARAMFLRFFPGEEEKAARFSESIPDHKLSMARLQQHMLQHRAESAAAALESAGELLDYLKDAELVVLSAPAAPQEDDPVQVDVHERVIRTEWSHDGGMVFSTCG